MSAIALVNRTPAERTAYGALLARVRTDLLLLRGATSNPDTLTAPLKKLLLHLDAEERSLETAADRIARQRARTS